MGARPGDGRRMSGCPCLSTPGPSGTGGRPGAGGRGCSPPRWGVRSRPRRSDAEGTGRLFHGGTSVERHGCLQPDCGAAGGRGRAFRGDMGEVTPGPPCRVAEAARISPGAAAVALRWERWGSEPLTGSVPKPVQRHEMPRGGRMAGAKAVTGVPWCTGSSARGGTRSDLPPPPSRRRAARGGRRTERPMGTIPRDRPIVTDFGRASALLPGWESRRARRPSRTPSPPVAYRPARGKSEAERGEILVGRTCGRPSDRFVHIF